MIGAGAGSADPLPRGSRRGRGRLGAGLALLLALAACDRTDPLMRADCLAVVPALEPDAPRIEVVSLAPLAERHDTLRVVYRTEESGVREIACAFAEDVAGGGRALVGVRTDAGDLAVARLFALRRFFLADPRAVAEGVARLDLAPEARARGLVSLDAGPALRLQQGLDALVPAALYALLGLACSLVYGLIGRVVFLFGDLAMLGAYASVMVGVAGAWLGPVAAAAMAPLAVLVAALLVGAWGRAIGDVVFAPLGFRALQPLLVATVGLSIALQEFVARAQGVRDLHLSPPVGTAFVVADGPFEVLLAPGRLALVAIAAATIAAVVAILPRTRFGRAWRAVADDATMAAMLGIDPRATLVGTVALAGGLAGGAGALHTLAWGGTSFHMGTILGLKAVVAAVLGGIGSLPGAVVGGVALAAVEAVWTAAFGGDWREAAVFALFVAVLIWRPDGLFAARPPR